VAYASPSTNPFFGSAPGRDEIFAYGLRNPWRFSFDRLTGDQWVGDVGQDAWEELDTPIVNGGNYGWRVYEGFTCTNNDPSLCTPTNYLPPILSYQHLNGRCSITGGYVYRGPAGTLPSGTYVYGDYCSGEIFTWNGSSQALLLDTALNISSFGEDEAGELYVVGLGGSLSKLVSSGPCSYSIAPTSTNLGAGAATGSVGDSRRRVYLDGGLECAVASRDVGRKRNWQRKCGVLRRPVYGPAEEPQGHAHDRRPDLYREADPMNAAPVGSNRVPAATRRSTP
jgi:hypothetical protein